MNENEYTTVNERFYSNPELNISESNQFLESLRNAQQQGAERIATTTHALGTDVPSRMGGLGGTDTFVQRYQTPQVENMVSGLRAAAQGQALTEQLSNILAQKQQEYKQAYRDAYKRAEDKAKQQTYPSGGGGGGNDGGDGTQITTNYTDGAEDMSVSYQPEGPNTLVPTGADGYYTYQRQTGDSLDTQDRTYALRGINQAEAGLLQSDMRFMNPSNNEIRNVNGQRYMYIQNNQVPNGSWFAIDVIDLGDTAEYGGR